MPRCRHLQNGANTTKWPPDGDVAMPPKGNVAGTWPCHVATTYKMVQTPPNGHLMVTWQCHPKATWSVCGHATLPPPTKWCKHHLMATRWWHGSAIQRQRDQYVAIPRCIHVATTPTFSSCHLVSYFGGWDVVSRLHGNGHLAT